MLCENSLNTRPKPKSTISGASRAIHHKYCIFRFSILPNVFLQFSTERLAVVCFGSFISCSTRYWVSQFVYSIARTAEVLTDLTGRRARRRWFLTFSFSSSCRHSCWSEKASICLLFALKLHYHDFHLSPRRSLGSLTFDVLFAGCCCRPLSRFRFGFCCFAPSFCAVAIVIITASSRAHSWAIVVWDGSQVSSKVSLMPCCDSNNI